MPVRLYEISNKLGIENRQVIAKAKELGITAAKVASSSLDRITAEYLIGELEKDLASSFNRGFRALGLGNFKAFAEMQNVPIRPLTLIFGANSSGKSTVIHGLLFARHALETENLNVSHTAIGGDSVDLGGFSQFVHRRDVSRRVEWSAELNADSLRGQARQLLGSAPALRVTLSFAMRLDNYGQAVTGSVPWLFSYEIETTGNSVLRLSRRPDGSMHLDRLDPALIQPLTQAVLYSVTTTERLDSQGDSAAIREAVETLIPSVRFTARGLLPDRLLGEQSATLPQLVPIPKAGRRDQLVNATNLFIPRAIAEVVSGVNIALRDQLARLQYLGPLRSFPPRHLAFAGDHDRNWRAGGGYAWDLVRTNEKLREKVNAWLTSPERMQTPYRLTVERLFTSSDAESALERGLGSIAADLERKRREAIDTGTATDDMMAFPFDSLGSPEHARELLQTIHKHSERNAVDELILMDCRTNTQVTHRDVGIGVSQVLPVLVHAFANEGKIVAVEQPEIHLHPALQAELGDVFIESALGERKNTFLLETHSEHLILRILRRVRETTEQKLPAGAPPIRPEDVTVVFVEPTANGSLICHLPVTPDGDFAAPWPGGFFAERLTDLP
jgi:hypothetical protein